MKPKGTKTAVIQELESKGFKSTYEMFDEKEQAKEAAKNYRKEGYFARVMTVIFPGKIYNRERIMIYIKEK